MMALEQGSKAPDFRLYDTERKERSLSEFLGNKTILAFYPGAFTGVCSQEMCALRDSMAEFNALNAQVVGISVDSTFANAAFRKENNLSFPLLSDYDRKVSAAYTGLYQNFGGVPGYTAARRSVFVLDANGTVTYVWGTENPGEEPDYAALKKALA